jgi:uncharacterized coiled-coil protein SlyX
MWAVFLKWFTTAGGGWIGYAIVAGAIYAAGAASGVIGRGFIDAPTIAGLKADVAKEQAATSKQVARYNALTAQINAAMQQIEKDRADANVIAADQARKDSDTIAGLQSKLSAEQIAHAKTSAQLTAELNHALSSEDRPLGPASLRFFDGLRNRQTSTRSTTGTNH